MVVITERDGRRRTPKRRCRPKRRFRIRCSRAVDAAEEAPIICSALAGCQAALHAGMVSRNFLLPLRYERTTPVPCTFPARSLSTCPL
jgi:hypothetical protein